MRYLFGTGLIGAVMGGVSLLRGSRETPVTWRAVLAWVSWGITLALAIGAAVDLRRAEKGIDVDVDSPVAAKQIKQAKRDAKREAKEEKRASR
ncbi:hypothetical protein [Microbacterium istanbulense]|uniref:NADH:ubiquinone oxidoreductase n=1 Tax=Microbacterium istanbulense TaxID=3122049 RepID=A0ABU8LNH2_9MICO